MNGLIDTYYDLTCSCCAKSRSTDFEMGMETQKARLVKYARAEGWRCIQNKLFCPDCAPKEKGRG